MTRIRIQRTFARVAERVERIDGHVAHIAEVGLIADVRESELVGAAEDVAGRLRERVEALRFEVRADARVEADVDALVVGEAFAVPEPEVRGHGGAGEAARAGGGIDRIRAEAERDVAIARADRFEVETEVVVDLRRIAERE